MLWGLEHTRVLDEEALELREEWVQEGNRTRGGLRVRKTLLPEKVVEQRIV